MLQLFQWLPLATFNDDSRSQFPCLMWFIKQKYGLMIISGVYSRVSMHGGWYLEAFFMPEILFAYQRKQTHLHTHTHTRWLYFGSNSISKSGVHFPQTNAFSLFQCKAIDFFSSLTRTLPESTRTLFSSIISLMILWRCKCIIISLWM